jgi:hypothetical protein
MVFVTKLDSSSISEATTKMLLVIQRAAKATTKMLLVIQRAAKRGKVVRSECGHEIAKVSTNSGQEMLKVPVGKCMYRCRVKDSRTWNSIFSEN